MDSYALIAVAILYGFILPITVLMGARWVDWWINTSQSVGRYNKKEKKMDKIKVYKNEQGEWRWQRKAPNGEIISSGEAHTRESDAVRAAARANQDSNWTYTQGA